MCVPVNINEEIVAFGYCIFDDCNSLATDLKEELMKNPAMAEKYEADNFNTVSEGLNGGSMANSNKDVIFGYDRAGYRKATCKNPYDEDNTETHYILGWMPDIGLKMEKDKENKEKADKNSFRFKQLNSDQHGFKIKMGGIP